MARGGRRQRRWHRLIWALAAVSVVGLLLPQRLTGRLMNLVQVLLPIQAGATRLADGAGDVLNGGPGTVPADEHQRVMAEAAALRRRVASLSAQVAGLQDANRQLTGLRERVGPSGVLIPARLVAGDLLDWRSSALVDAGTLRGVKPDAAVTTRTPGLDIGVEDGARDGMAVLAGEVLVGWVEHAGTHSARVKLLSDPTCRLPVAIGRHSDDDFSVLSAVEGQFWLVGAGKGHLHVIDVDHRYIEGDSAAIQVRDLVITPQDDPRLPVPLTIGTITGVEPDQHNRLLYTLAVESVVPTTLRQVYVLDLAGQ